MERGPLIGLFLPMLITVPIVILNIFISIRKGRSPLLYGVLSLFPFVGFFLAIYLASLIDKSVGYKIDKIISLLESRQSGAGENLRASAP